MTDSDEKTTDYQLELITRNLAEVVGREDIRSIIIHRPLKIYWGTATTAPPHIGYFVPMLKIADFLRADCDVTILFADLHAFLDSTKTPWDLLLNRVRYYQTIITVMLRDVLRVDTDNLTFVCGTDFQLDRNYSTDVYKLAALTTVKQAQKAGAEVVKQSESPCLSGLLYPILQALDEEYLHVDAQFGGVDQRKIFMFARENLPKIGYRKRIHLLNPMVAGLNGGKMSSSNVKSKIGLLDTGEEVRSKIMKAYCPPRKDNALLQFFQQVIFALRPTVTIARSAQYGPSMIFSSPAELTAAYLDGTVHPTDLKCALIEEIDRLLEPIRQRFCTAEMQQLIAAAYPK